VLRALVIGLILALSVPAIAFGQSQSGTTGSGNGSQSGAVTNSQTNSQSAIGNGNVQNATNQNCVAGRDCVNNNVTNQNAAPSRTFERSPVVVRRARVRSVVLAHTGTNLAPLFLIGGLLTAGGLGVLTLARRRGIRSLA
jgi:hypothetical protein